MTRGKHAVKAANRRVTQITEKLEKLEAKHADDRAKWKVKERELRGRIQALSTRKASRVSDDVAAQITAERERHADEVAALKRSALECFKVLGDALLRNPVYAATQFLPDDLSVFSPFCESTGEVLDAVYGPSNRGRMEQRRWASTSLATGDRLLSTSRQEHALAESHGAPVRQQRRIEELQRIDKTPTDLFIHALEWANDRALSEQALVAWSETLVSLRPDHDFHKLLTLDTERAHIPGNVLGRQPFPVAFVELPRPVDFGNWREDSGYDFAAESGVVVGALVSGVDVDGQLTALGHEPREIALTACVFNRSGIHLSEHVVDVSEGWRIGASDPHDDQSVAVQIEAQVLPLLAYLGSARIDTQDSSETGIGSTPAGAIRRVDVGCRVGDAIRSSNLHTGEPSPSRGSGTGRSPRSHVRGAHWHRYRVAARDGEGEIIGDTNGKKNVDWFYTVRWIAPTWVSGIGQPSPTVRPVAAAVPGSITQGGKTSE